MPRCARRDRPRRPRALLVARPRAAAVPRGARASCRRAPTYRAPAQPAGRARATARPTPSRLPRSPLRQVVACRLLVRRLRAERLDERGQRGGALDARRLVGDPHLERPEPRMRPCVPPAPRVVLAGRLDSLLPLLLPSPSAAAGRPAAARAGAPRRDESPPVSSPARYGELSESASTAGSQGLIAASVREARRRSSPCRRGRAGRRRAGASRLGPSSSTIFR